MVELLMDLGLDVEKALILEDELSRLPKRTRRVFELRAMGYPQQLIASDIGIGESTVRDHLKICKKLVFDPWFCPKNRPYTNRGSNAN